MSLYLLDERKRRVRSTIPTATVPSYGSAILNDNMETGDPPTGWTQFNSATLDGVADERTGGSGVQSLSAVAAGNAGADKTISALTIGTWYSFSAWQKAVSGAVGIGVGSLTSGRTRQFWTGYSSTSSWNNPIGTFQALNADTNVAVFTQAGGESRADDILIQPITLASTLRLAFDFRRKRGVFRSWPTVATLTQAGIAVCVDDETNPTYGLWLWTNRTNVTLKKLVAGTWSTLIDTATGVTYAAGRELRPVINGSTVTVYYESAAGVLSQIGTPQTVDLSSFGTKVSAFDPSGTNSLGRVEARAA